MRTLNGKRVLITGSASGIGKSIAKRFAAEGAHLLLADLNEPLLLETAKELARGRTPRAVLSHRRHRHPGSQRAA